MKKGFTIIEVLLTAVLVSVMSVVVFSVFSKGLDVWARSNQEHRVERDARFALEKIARELRNSFALKGFSFRATTSSLSFITFLHNPTGSLNSPLASQGIGRVEYIWDEYSSTLMRQSLGYDEMFKSFEKPAAEPFLRSVKKFTVQFYRYSEKIKLYEWTNSWQESDGFPLGVKLALIIQEGKQQKEILKTVMMMVDLNARKTSDVSAK